jgi:hypothetical protein
MAIQDMRIRATIQFGNVVVQTPYILSFSVTKTRNSKSTFSASLKIPSGELDSITGNKITISSGTKRNEIQIFTGYILSSRPSICFDDPNYTILNVSGSDILYVLEGEKYTRRQLNSKAKWAIIDGVTRKAEKGGQFEINYVPVQTVDMDVISDAAKNNKTNTTQDLSSMGNSNLSDGYDPFQFTFSAVSAVSVEGVS